MDQVQYRRYGKRKKMKNKQEKGVLLKNQRNFFTSIVKLINYNAGVYCSSFSIRKIRTGFISGGWMIELEKEKLPSFREIGII